MKPKRTLFLGAMGIVLLIVSSLNVPAFLVWNRTSSVPIGLYWIDRNKRVEVGALVLFQPNEALQSTLEEQGFIGPDWPLIKRVVALERDQICRRGETVSLNGTPIARAHQSDQLPSWQGCLTLESNDIFLLNEHPDSIDGRYFGVQGTQYIKGHAKPIWTISGSQHAPGTE